ncbi:MAG: hypothetical protein IPM34_06445 [Saprospiraceae bacterium]|nr:hypothetical protein [Saprospiraceae bacterium]
MLIISILLISLWTVGCSGTKTPAQEGFTVVGDGGGFTGVETLYKIWDKGRIEKDGQVVARLSNNEMQQIADNRKTLQLDQLEWMKPGNIYHLLEFSNHGITKKMVWDPYDPDHPKSLELYYNHLIHLIKKNIK